jgi:hypothetical protein
MPFKATSDCPRRRSDRDSDAGVPRLLTLLPTAVLGIVEIVFVPGPLRLTRTTSPHPLVDIVTVYYRNVQLKDLTD